MSVVLSSETDKADLTISNNRLTGNAIVRECSDANMSMIDRLANRSLDWDIVENAQPPLSLDGKQTYVVCYSCVPFYSYNHF